MNELYHNSVILTSAFTFVMYFLFLFTGSPPNIILGSHIAGYSILLLGITLLVIFNILKIVKRVTESNANNMQAVTSVIRVLSPFTFTIGSMILILYLIITHKSSIVKNHVSFSYYSFSNIAIILFFVQIFLLYTQGDKPVTYNLLYLLGLLTTICGVILYTILSYFSTDG